MGHIYFIGCTETLRVKIGYTSGNPYSRLAALQTGSPTELRIMAVAPGSMPNELALHLRFAASRVRGEWFEMSEELFEHMSIVTWLAAVQCRDADYNIPEWLPLALEVTGAAGAFPSIAGESIQ